MKILAMVRSTSRQYVKSSLMSYLLTWFFIRISRLAFSNSPKMQNPKCTKLIITLVTTFIYMSLVEIMANEEYFIR